MTSSKIQSDLYAIFFLHITAFVMSFVYKNYRWRMVDDASHYCIQCSYILTGNESGTCPECGTEIKP